MNYYAQAIDIIINPDTDFRAIVIEVAKKHPKSVVEVAADPDPVWMDEVDACLRGDQKLAAIKVWRTHTGDSLLEAKDAVEARQAEKGL